MLDVLAGRSDDIAWPFVVALLGVASTWLPSRDLRHRAAAAIGISAGTFLVVARARLPAILDALSTEPRWFSVAAIGAGAVTAVAMARMLGTGRGPEGMVVLGVGVGTAAAALPDVETLVGAAALLLPWVAARRVPGRAERPRRHGQRPARDRWLVAVVAAIIAAVPVVALVDGARGRPGSLLVAPLVVGPVALATCLPPPASRLRLCARAGTIAAVGLLAARHAALGSGTLPPLVGSLLALVALGALVALPRLVTGAATPGPDRGR